MSVSRGGGGGDPLVLGGSLCSEYLALQSEEEDQCEAVREQKCFTQDSTQCVTQYVKVTPLLSLLRADSLLSEELPCEKGESVPGGKEEV